MSVVATLSDVGQTKLDRVTVYIDPEVKKKLEKLAKLKKRTVSNLVSVLIDEAIQDAEQSGAID
jgi:predicted transcriptional regulator